MTYPITCVWEITMACNMRCKHCGSICENALPGELTTEEALKFVDSCAEIGMQWISISGGEPFMRKDLVQIIKYAIEKGLGINIITNGWFINEEIAKELGSLGGGVRVMISLEGPEYIHDFVRKQGSFQRSKKSFETLNKYGVETGSITTITKQNIDHLDELKYFLIENGVKCWQVQIGLPMGSLGKRPDWVLDPKQMNDIIDYCYKVSKEGKIDIFPADCIGYYNSKQDEVYKRSYHCDENEKIPEWEGCTAGIYSFGILHNGDIIGCTSIRNKEYIEGNIKEKSLREIWENPDNFSWRRKFTKENLKGDCLKCSYAERCLGGCPNTRRCMNGTINSENLYCTQNLLLKENRV